jgi:hypothetical protein
MPRFVHSSSAAALLLACLLPLAGRASTGLAYVNAANLVTFTDPDEAEPGPADTHALNAAFLMNGRLEQTIARDVNGSAGALLTLTSDADWAVGQLRYTPLVQTAAPEPRPWGLVPAGLALLLAITRKLHR